MTKDKTTKPQDDDLVERAADGGPAYNLKTLADSLEARGQAQGWFKDGKLTRTGEKAALEYMIGWAQREVEISGTLPPVVWVASVRGVQEFLEKHRHVPDQLPF